MGRGVITMYGRTKLCGVYPPVTIPVFFYYYEIAIPYLRRDSRRQ